MNNTMSKFNVFARDGVRSDEYQITTLCYLKRENPQGETEYLLAKHYRQGKWNGFGGKVGDKPEFRDETIEESLQREGLEEFGIKVIIPEKRGVILFRFFDEQGDEIKIQTHLFFADQFEGEVTASTEMLTPTWFTAENMPWGEMWPNDRIWLEQVIKREQFLEAEFSFDPGMNVISSESVIEWKDLPTKNPEIGA